MKKILLTIIFSIGMLVPLNLYAELEYNENITDIYFGNGVWNTYQQADDAKVVIRKKLLKKGTIKDSEIYYSKEENPTIGTDNTIGKKYAFNVAYNWHGMYRDDSTHDDLYKMFFDVAETFVQLKESGQLDDSSIFKYLEWSTQVDGISEELIQLADVYIALATTTRLSNVVEMQTDYQQFSFDKGHRVLLVSHSQGNLWANDMVNLFQLWQKEYFRNVGVAVPADNLEAESRYTTLSCDLVIVGVPNHLAWNKECNGVEEISGHELLGSYFKNANAEFKIFRDIEFYLLMLDSLPSQWLVENEYNKGTKDYKIELKHFSNDNSVDNITEVFPFNKDKKVYQVPMNSDMNELLYVKASSGGTKILDADYDTWTDKKDNELYYLEGTGEVISQETSDTLKYDNVKLIYASKVYSTNGYYYIHKVTMGLIGYKDSNRTMISKQEYTFVSTDKLPAYGTYFNTSDVEYLKKMIGRKLFVASPASFDFTQEIFDALIE